MGGVKWIGMKKAKWRGRSSPCSGDREGRPFWHHRAQVSAIFSRTMVLTSLSSSPGMFLQRLSW